MLAAVMLITISFWLTGCKSQQPPTADLTGARPAASSQLLAGTRSQYFDFNQADYTAALESDKLVMLYFYADWCPVCRFEVKRLKEAFGDLETDGVIGFQVNYNDKYTEPEEEELAREFGVAYQHTKIFLKKGERVLKSPESWGKERYLEEIENLLK